MTLHLTSIFTVVTNKNINRNTLVAILNKREDLAIALKQNWYRIPIKTKRTPLSVSERRFKYIAFYQTSVFGNEAFTIKWYAEVKNITIQKRKELIPEELLNPKADNNYYKIEFFPCESLANPIISQRHRRMLFVNTTYERLLNAKEFNDLFIESPIEEKLWEKFRQEKISAERQFMVQTEDKLFYLDFALFCGERNLNIECDGDKYHLSVDAVKYDKKRNNLLTKLGWIVLRYHSEQIKQNINIIIDEVKETINRYGGLQLISGSQDLKYFSSDEQIGLFD